MSDDTTIHDSGDSFDEASPDAGSPDAAPSRRRAPFIVAAVALVIAGLLVVLIGAKTNEADSADSPLLGRPAPAVQTTTLDGRPFDLQRRKGSWVVFNFFNSTCVPCVQEHPELAKFAAEQAKLTDGAEFYTVVWDDNHGAVQKFFADNGGSWPILTDDDARIEVAFGVAKVPETWIIDPNGFVVSRHLGGTTDDQLTRLLAQAKAGL
jgi:cytochrome c biogenesis protein CcmG/thiol:disulfide interchange protein DsbE